MRQKNPLVKFWISIFLSFLYNMAFKKYLAPKPALSEVEGFIWEFSPVKRKKI